MVSLLHVEVAIANDVDTIDVVDCESFSQVKELAESNDANAALQIAKGYISGHCVPRDPEEGAKWLNKSASLGNPVAQGDLAAFLQKAGDNKGAATMAALSAAQGDPQGQFVLAYLLQHGLGVTQNDTEAVKWARLSAEQDNPGAQIVIGFYYELGKGGLTADKIEADKWYILAQRHFPNQSEDPEFSVVRKHIEQHMSAQEIAQAEQRAVIWRTHTR